MMNKVQNIGTEFSATRSQARATLLLRLSGSSQTMLRLSLFLLAGCTLFLTSAAMAQTVPQDPTDPLLAQTAPAQAPVAEGDDIRVQLTPKHEAALASRMAGMISDVPVKDGQSVKEGDVLISFECTQQKQKQEQAEARMARQEKLLSSAKKLVELGSGSKLDLNVRQAEYQEAQAAMALSQADASYCDIKAPFDGRIASLPAKAFQNVRENEPLVEIIQDSELEAELMVPSSWLSWLKVGTVFPIKVDETSGQYDAKVTQLGGRVDPVTQTVKIYASVVDRAPELLAGMTGTALFDDITPKKNAANTAPPVEAPPAAVAPQTP
jgi:membrane fusion protein (multidrug efflux system)